MTTIDPAGPDPLVGVHDRPGLIAERAAWREEFAGVGPTRLVFHDQIGASTAMGRTLGRAPGGWRVVAAVPQGQRRAAGAEVRYLTADSPDFNPCDRLFSDHKARLVAAKSRTAGGLIEAIGDAPRAIRAGDSRRWFAHGG